MGRGEFLALVEGYLAGSLDAAALAALEAALLATPRARRLFTLAVGHEVLVRQYAFEQLDAAAAVPAAPAAPTAPTTARPRAWWRQRAARMAAAALLLLAVGLLALLLVPARALGQPAETPLAHLVVVLSNAQGANGGLVHRDAARSGQRSPVTSEQVGSTSAMPHQLHPGMALLSGDSLVVPPGASAELRFDREDTTISVSGGSQGAKLLLDEGTDGIQLLLASGRLDATVAHQAAGRHLAIGTHEAAVTVIGTRLMVSSDEARTVIAVHEGRVAVRAGGASAEIAAGERAEVGPGTPLAVGRVPALTWSDRRPIGLMMLCTASPLWKGNPRGWFNDPVLNLEGAEGQADFNQRCDQVLERTIAKLRAMDAQGVVFWDLEGRELPLGYLGDPRLLARAAPEMEEHCDRMFARLRAAGFAVGVAVRTQEVQLVSSPPRAVHLLAVHDPERVVAAKISYARARWGATIFPLLGGAGELGMGELCRRVLADQRASAPAVLLMPVADSEDAYRWCAPWQDPAAPVAATPAAARRAIPGAFAVWKSLELLDLERDREGLVQAVAAGDIMTFRAWYDDPTHPLLQSILSAGAALRRQPQAPPR